VPREPKLWSSKP